MEKPQPGDMIICPNSRSHSRRAPVSVWVGNKKKKYGVIGPHSHGFYQGQCEYTGHAVPVEEVKR